MTQPAFDNLASILQSHEVQGSSVVVTFRCTETGIEAEATASLQRDTGVAADAARTAKRGLWSSLRRSVTRAITQALGSGTAGRVARGVADSAMKNAQQNQNWSKAEVQGAVVRAFESVQNKFSWDAEANAWRGANEPATAFDKRLADTPVTGTYDRGILARTLIELSAADGDIGSEERAFLQDFIDPAIGTIDELAQRGALTSSELGETDAETRDSILMLAWACTMCDGELDDREVTRLGEIANGLGIDADRAGALRVDAQQFLFEQTLASTVYSEGKRDETAWNDAVAAASKMGIESAVAEKLDAGYRKRCGLV